MKTKPHRDLSDEMEEAVNAELAQLRGEVDQLKKLVTAGMDSECKLDRALKDLSEIREACPLVRQQDYFEASTLKIVQAEISALSDMRAECRQLREQLRVDGGEEVMSTPTIREAAGLKPRQRVTVDIKSCLRCGQDHFKLPAKPFDRPPSIGPWTLGHWALCPVSGDPLLVNVDIVQSSTKPHDA